MEDFASFVEAERNRITERRNLMLAERNDIDNEIGALDKEMLAIAAYEDVKAGKTLRQMLSPAQAKARRSRSSSNGTRAPRQGSRRFEIIELIGANPDGLVRAGILDQLGVKGDKSGEMSVSNALTALIKNNTLTRNKAKRYVLSNHAQAQ